jgi:NAD(P)-dependent dehydrogenase (short-subunit alcohol dehydrogenase family)
MIKTIIITGTSRGLGLAILNKLIYNFNIATISRTNENYEENNLLNFSGDITNYCDRQNFIRKVIEKFGTIDILINNAGIINLKSFLDYNELDYEQIFNVNVFGTYFLTKLCIEQMLTQKTGGHIINIGSTRAITGAPDKSLYSMSKFALRSMTQCINAEFKDKNIKSTIICPGQLDDITKEVLDTIEFLIKYDIKTIPEIRIGGML